MTTVSDVCKVLELLAPAHLAQSWDNVGLQLGRGEQEVHTIMVALDVTPEVVQQAVAEKVELLITHHPLFFAPVHNLVVSDEQTEAIYSLIKHEISVYAAHTNLDAAPGGVNDVLAECLKLKQVEVFACGSEDHAGLGRIGVLREELSLEEFAAKLHKQLGVTGVSVVAAGKSVYKVAVVGGAGSEFMEAALLAGADTLVTGDVKYHVAQKAQSLGLNLVDAGHQGTEAPVVARLQEALQEWALNEKRAVKILRAEQTLLLQHM